jgi:hypothetical protein
MPAVQKTLLFALLASLGLLWTPPANAAGITVKAGQTVKLKLPRQPRIIGVENPAIAALKVLPDGHALLTGLRAGRTRIIGRDYAEVPIIIGVTVVSSGSRSHLRRQPH